MSRLVLMGSGETAPSLVGVHRKLLASLARPVACWFDTPYGFQENADLLSRKTVDFFHDSLGVALRIASLRGSETSEKSKQQAYTVAQESNYLLSGPGSPSYVLQQWQDSALPTLFLDKLSSGDNVVLFASATACAVGAACLPVYEIYKVGQKPHWLPGLDLLGQLGFAAVVLPHYNNTVGGNHDTRFCYMGERRLQLLERQLEQNVTIWGVDEHTALQIDLAAERFEVRGKGGFTLRHQGRSLSYPNGFQGELELLRRPSWEGAQPATPAGAAPSNATHVATQGVITELAKPHQAGFEEALGQGRGEAAAHHLLAIEQLLEEWSSDTDSHHRQLARASFRQLLLRLGQAGERGLCDPKELVGPLVESLLSLRSTARTEGRYDLSDRVRTALDSYGIEVRDTSDGVSWSLRASAN